MSKHSGLPWSVDYPEIFHGTGDKRRSILRVPTPDEFPELYMTDEEKQQVIDTGKANLEFVCKMVNSGEDNCDIDMVSPPANSRRNDGS